MAKRVRLEDKVETIGSYFTSEKEIELVSSGCCMLDNVLGGGYPLGRITNIVGDKSTAKTALACEAIINFLLEYDGFAAYRDIEEAFDEAYSAEMGMPIDEVDFGPEEPINTIEDWGRDLEEFITKCQSQDKPGIYVLDSLDALTDEATLESGLSAGSYDMTKQKQLGKILRNMIRKMGEARVLLIIVSQVRENIGVAFGEKYRRAGGKSLDFYASQALWLAHTGILKKTRNKINHPIGIKVKGRIKKNKIGFPHRECEFDFIFGFGVDDIGASLTWLEKIGQLGRLNLTKKEINSYIKSLEHMDDEEYDKERRRITKHTKKVWREVETTFLPKRKKYT